MNSANKNNHSVVSFARSGKLPEPEERGVRGKQWISWGKDDLYPQWLNRLFYESPYQSGIIRQKVFFIAGGGFEIIFNDEQSKAKWDDFKNNMPNGISFDDLITENTLDGELYNGFAIKGSYNRKGEVSYFESLDFDKIRTDAKETCYYYSDDWGVKKQSYEETGFKVYRAYNPLDTEKNDFIVYYKYPSKEYRKAKRKTDMGLYPKPSYSGGLKDISTDIEMSSYHFHEILNGMKTGTIIYLGNGEPHDPTDKQKMEEQIKEGSTGIETSGGIILMYGKGSDQKPEVLHLNGNDLDRRYLMTEEAVQKKILVAHSVVTPTLFGIQTAGQLGNATELENGYNIFIKTYVRARQTVLGNAYTRILNNILKIDCEVKLMEGELIEKQVVETPLEPTHQSHSKDSILDALMVAGVPRKQCVVLSRKQMPVEFSSDEAINLEIKHWREVDTNQYYFNDLLTELQRDVLKMLSDEEAIESIAEALDITDKKAIATIEELQEKKLIKKNRELSNKGIKALDSIPTQDINFEVRYTYEERADAPPLKPGGKSRPFCTALLDNPRMYTRKEIDTLSTAVNRDVWSYRGGWYTNPNTKQHSPYCRHIWVQNIVYRP